MLIQRQDQSQIKAKAFAISSIMNNPKLANTIFDGWDAKNGSTKKKQARNILKSINVAASNRFRYDGQGGGGTINLFDLDKNYSTPQFTNPIVSGAKKIATGTKEALKATGNIASNLLPTKFVPGVASFLKTSFPQTPQTQTNIPPNIYGLGKTPTSELEGKVGYTTSGRTDIGSTLATPDMSKFDITKLGGITTDPARAGDMFPVTKTDVGVTEGEYKWWEKPGDLLGKTEPWKGETGVESKEGMTTETEEDSIIPQLGEMSGDEIDAWYNGLDASYRDYYKELYDAVKRGIGGETFALQMLMGDSTKLGNLLGMSPEAAAKLPGGLLSQQLIDLRDSISDEKRIKEQENRILNLQNRGLTIELDLTNYITGKDEYLEKIDGLIGQYKKKLVNMDTSNPYVAKRMENYGNYLTILRGRQEKRYIDFLDQSINYHNAELAQATNMYELSLKDANEAIADLSAVRTEEYGNIKSMLKDLYANVEKRTEVARDTIRWGYEQSASAYDVMIKGLELENLKKNSGLDLTPSQQQNFSNFKNMELAEEFRDISFPAPVIQYIATLGSLEKRQKFSKYLNAKLAEDRNADIEKILREWIQIDEDDISFGEYVSNTATSNTANEEDDVLNY